MTAAASCEALLFDAAGTLIELVEPVGESYARIAAEHGVQLPAWRLGDAFARVVRGAQPMVFPEMVAAADPESVQRGERDWWRRVVRSTFLAADSTTRFSDFDACFDDLWRHFAGPAWAERDGVHETLAALAEGPLLLGVVSNFDHRLPGILELLDIAHFFDVITLPGEVGAAKPDRRLIEAALDALGASAAQALFVGDDALRDGGAATAAGVRFLDLRELGSFDSLPARLGTPATLPREHDPGSP